MNNTPIDIKKLTDTELKAMVYDQLVTKEPKQ